MPAGGGIAGEVFSKLTGTRYSVQIQVIAQKTWADASANPADRENARRKAQWTGLLSPATEQATATGLKIAMLTGGVDKPYVLGLTPALVAEGMSLEVIGSDDLICPELCSAQQIRFLNLRGSQDSGAPLRQKVSRILRYYARLIKYAATAEPPVFHILWNDKFEFLDRVLLTLYYRLLGKKVVFTAHNVNAAKRDGKDSWLNRLSLRIQYRLCDHIFVHTEKMKQELTDEFAVPAERATVIPFGINNTLPNTSLTSAAARAFLGLTRNDRVLLFFGRIAPYKGLDYLITAVSELLKQNGNYRLVIAGSIKDCPDYWSHVQATITRTGCRAYVAEKIGFIPDEQVEVYFKAADLNILPYTDIFQSGVLFLSYSFGLPVVATDVGTFSHDIVEGETGFVCRPRDPSDLASKIDSYFRSELFTNLPVRRHSIREYASERNSWAKVGDATRKVYLRLLAKAAARDGASLKHGEPSCSSAP